MSVKQDMQKAKQLIQAGDYDKARALLITIDHPTAGKWLAKLPQGKVKKPVNKITLALLAIVVTVLIGLSIYYYVNVYIPAQQQTEALSRIVG